MCLDSDHSADWVLVNKKLSASQSLNLALKLSTWNIEVVVTDTVVFIEECGVGAEEAVHAVPIADVKNL